MQTRALFSLIMIATATRSYALHWDTVQTYATNTAAVREMWFPVGCELRGCCPGCSLTDPIDLEIHIDTTVTASVALQIVNLPPNELEGLRITGKATRKGNVVIAGPGESIVGGFSEDPSRPVPIVFVQPVLSHGASSKSTGSIEILQKCRGAIVNSFRHRFTLSEVSVATGEHDRIHIVGNTAHDNAVVMMDFRSGMGCECDRIFRGRDDIEIGDARWHWRCNSEVSVFARGLAMSYETRVRGWSRHDDVHEVDLQPMIRVPMTIYLARPNAEQKALDDLTNANYLYDQNRVGVHFEATVKDLSSNSGAMQTIVNAACVTPLNMTAFYKPNEINVYYVSGLFTGETCGGDHNTVRVGANGNLATIAHELGHAFGLFPLDGGHTECVPGFGNDNIMWGGGLPTRSTFSIGQAFRMNVRESSELNLNGTRHGPTRNCAPLTIDLYCPILSLSAP